MYCLLSFQRKMRFCLKKFFFVCSILLVSFVGYGISYEANTWYTDFSFAGNSKIYTFYVSGGEDSGPIPFYLMNNSDFIISWNFDVVDAVDMWSGLFACKANWQNEIFGQYWTFQQTWFLVWLGETFSGSVNMKFPEWYSGEYLWCITYTPFWAEDTGFVISQPRKAIFLKAILNATASLYKLKVFPWSRSKPSLANKWEIRFYNMNDELVYFNEDILSDSSWNAEFSALIPDGLYNVVYKWQSHLASYLSGVSVIAWRTFMFDFNSWSNLIWVKNKSDNEDDWFKYQIAWDLKNISWKYDFIVNSLDISVLTMSWYIDSGVSELDPKNLNGDTAINWSDLSIIWINFKQQDIFYWSGMYKWAQ